MSRASWRGRAHEGEGELVREVRERKVTGESESEGERERVIFSI